MKNIYQITLNRSNLDKDEVSCTGKQLALILDAIRPLANHNKWYVVDVQVPGRYIIQPFAWVEKYDQIPLKIGSTSDLVNFVDNVPQFESGIFLSISEDSHEPPIWDTKVFDTEDLDYIEPAEIMIRAFDTSYFEVSSKEVDIIDRLTSKFIRTD